MNRFQATRRCIATLGVTVLLVCESAMPSVAYAGWPFPCLDASPSVRKSKSVWCCDDYNRKPKPCVSSFPNCCPDVYCPKPCVVLPCPTSCYCPDGYCPKPLPSDCRGIDSTWYKCISPSRACPLVPPPSGKTN